MSHAPHTNWPYRHIRAKGRDARNWIAVETHEEKLFRHHPMPWHVLAACDDVPYARHPKSYYYERKKKVIAKKRRAARNHKTLVTRERMFLDE